MEGNKANENNNPPATTGPLEHSEILHLNNGGSVFMPFPYMPIQLSPRDNRNEAFTDFSHDVREILDYPMADSTMLNAMQNSQFDLNSTDLQTDMPLVTPPGTANLNWNMGRINQSLNHDNMVNPGNIMLQGNSNNESHPNFGSSITPIFEHTEYSEYTKKDGNNVKINSNESKKIDGSFLSLGNVGNTESRSESTFSGEAVASPLKSPHGQQTTRDFLGLEHNLSSRFSRVSSSLGGGWASFNNDVGTIHGSSTRPSSHAFYNLQQPQVDMRRNISNMNSGCGSKIQEQNISADLDPHNTSRDAQNASSGKFTVKSNDLRSFGQAGPAPESVNATDQIQKCYMRRKSFSAESPAVSASKGFTKWNHSAGQLLSTHDEHAAPAGSHLFPEMKESQPNVASTVSRVSTATASSVPKMVVGSQVDGNAHHQADSGMHGYNRTGVQAAGNVNVGRSQKIGSIQYPRNVVGSRTPIGHPRGITTYQSPTYSRGISSTNGQFQNATPSFSTPIRAPITGQQVAYMNKPTPATNQYFGRPNLKRGAIRPPLSAPKARRSKPTLRPTPNLSVQQASPIISVPAYTAAHIKFQVREEVSEPVKEKCLICKRGLSYTPEGEMYEPAIPPPVAVLPCGHTFHDLCLQRITPEDQAKDPPCIPCAIGVFGEN